MGGSGYYNLLIPKPVFEKLGNGASMYLNGWYYTSNSNAYGFVTKYGSNGLRVCTLFEAGQNKSDSAKCMIYWR